MSGELKKNYSLYWENRVCWLCYGYIGSKNGVRISIQILKK